MASGPSGPVRLIASVVVTCAVAAAGLSVTYAATKDRIAEQERIAVERALAHVLGDAADGAQFTEVDEETLAAAREAAGETPVEAVFRAASSAGELAGWGVRVSPRGYGGPMSMVVGLDRDGKVVGVTVVTHRETPGLGDKVIASAEYLGRFVGLESAQIEAGAKGVDTVIGATKSSRGVRRGVVAAGHVWADVLSEEGAE